MMAQTTDLWALGFDIGGTSTKLGLVNPAGEISHFRHFPTNARGESADPFLKSLIENIGNLLDKVDGKITGIGASVHGWTDDARTGPILCFNTPALHGLNLKQILQDKFSLPVVINNDLAAHALAEYTFGSGRGIHRFLCLAMGTGLGAGVVVNGKPLRYVGGCAGDNGHIVIEPGGPSCSTGCKGCAEALCGISGIERLGKAQYGRDVTAREIISAARAGDDPIATNIMRQIGIYTGQLLASLSVTYLPDRIALTGGTVEAGPVLIDAAKERFEDLVGNYHRNFAQMGGDYYNGVDIVFGEMRGETGVVGATVEILQPYLNEESRR